MSVKPVRAIADDIDMASGGRPVAPWIRLAAVLVALGFGVLVVLVISFFTFAGARLGWLLSVPLFTLVLAGGARVAVSSRWPRARRRAVRALAVTGALLGLAAAHFAPPSAGRLRHQLDELLPSEWRIVDETASGSSLCFDVCTVVNREYRVAGSADDVLDQLRPLIALHRFERGDSYSTDRIVYHDRSGGDTDVRIEIVVGRGRTTTVYASAEIG